MRYGTSYFVDRHAANAYYARQHETAADVARKIAAGEIQIGKPRLKQGEKLSIIAGEGRYQIETKG